MGFFYHSSKGDDTHTKSVWKSHSNVSNSNVGRGYIKVFVCFVALHSKSTALVMAGRSVHLHVTTLFPGQA